MDEKIMRKKLMAYLRNSSQSALARELGVSSQYVNDIVHGRRTILGPAILKKFGYVAVTIIQKSKSKKGEIK